MKKQIATALLLTLVLACGEDNIEQTNEPAITYKLFSLNASREDGQPLDGEVSIIDNGGNYSLTLVGGSGQAIIPDGSGRALNGLYPYSDDAFLTSDGLSLTIPDRQDDCQDPDAALLNTAVSEFNFGSGSASAVFYSIGSVISLGLEDEDVTSISFASSDGRSPLAGSCFVQWDGGSPSLDFLANKLSVTIQNGGQPLQTGCHYIFCAPADLRDGAVLSMVYADGSIRMKKLDGPMSLERGKTLDLGSFKLSEIEKTPDFDETQIVTSIAMLSDTHIGNGYGSEAKFSSALRQLGAQASKHDLDGLDGVAIVGDVTDGNNANQAWSLKGLYEAVYSPADVPLVYTVGNHDMMNPLNPVLGDAYLATDVGTKEMREQHECRHNVIGGVHILGIAPSHYGTTSYDDTAKRWLDQTLAEVTAAEPEKYVLVITHPMIYDTCYGSLLGNFWYTSQLSATLIKYPQAVAFGGHLHFPINDPRSIWQGDFTSMGCGSVSYMAIEDGKYEYMKSATVMQDAGDISSGLLLQFDASGNMRITRMFFSRETCFGDPWEISYPVEDKSHLVKYNFNERSAVNTAPRLSTIDVIAGGGNTTATVSWAAGTDDEFVHHYTIDMYKDGSLQKTKKILADFYRSARPQNMKGSWSETFTGLTPGNYEFRIVAEDSWGATSNVLSKSLTL